MAKIVRCSNCEYFFSTRYSDAKRNVANGGALGSAIVGGVIGGHAGRTVGRTPLAASVPAGITAALMLGLSAVLGAEWALPLATCPRCSKHSGLLPPLRTGPRFATTENVDEPLPDVANDLRSGTAA